MLGNDEKFSVGWRWGRERAETHRVSRRAKKRPSTDVGQKTKEKRETPLAKKKMGVLGTERL